VRLVVDQQGAVLAGQLADGGQVTGLGQHDADVGQRGLHQHRGDIAVRQFPFQARGIVELRHPGGLARVHRRADVALP
jgi:hypothetical protein